MFAIKSLRQISESVKTKRQSKPLFGDGTFDNDLIYINSHLQEYERTIIECNELMKSRPEGKICELGAFLGIVSNGLRNMGYSVTSCDIPSFYKEGGFNEVLDEFGIQTKSFNLRNKPYPFSDSEFDLIIACETFEHLNFNPIPCLVELNRALKTGGYLYVAMPNSSTFTKRLKFLITGRYPGFSVKELYKQLDPNDNMIVGLHWREYSQSETVDLITPLGFELVQTYTKEIYGKNPIKNMIKFLTNLMPGGSSGQISVFKKTESVTLSSLSLMINPDS